MGSTGGGVMNTDVMLSQVSRFLKSSQLSTVKGTLFIMERDGMLVSSYDGDALKPDKSVVCNVGLWLNVQSSTRGPDELSRLAALARERQMN